MKKVTQRMKARLIALIMLCVNFTAFAETVEINGIFYSLQNNWSYGYYDVNGNWVSGGSYDRAAIVTYDPSINPWSVNNLETYQGDIVIPEKVTKDGVEYPVVAVGSNAFMRNRSLTSVQLPSNVVYIDSYVFYQCSMLTSVTMPGVVSLYNNEDLFYGSKITSLDLPKSLRSISNSIFINMSNLTSITVDGDNELYKSVDGVLYDKNVTKIVGFPAKRGGTYTIPAAITTIKSGSFPNYVSIDELIIPATVTKIENGAFGYSPQIKKLTLEDGNSELTIGTGSNSFYFNGDNGNSFDIYPMFGGTLSELYWGRPLKYVSSYSSPFAHSSLNKVTFGSKVTSIPKYTFYNCYSLTNVDVKGGLAQWLSFDFSDPYSSPFSSTYINEDNQFTVLFNGTEISGAFVIPDEITSIPSHGFQYGCTGITDLTIPATVTSIADGAFKGLSSLNTIQLAAGNTTFVVEDNVLYNKEKTKMLCFPQLRTGDYTMPATITEMGDYQFYKCINLTGVTLSDAILTIGQYAFAGCTNLATITMSASAKTIGQYAFANCSSLTSLTIPSSVEGIEDHAFDNCTALATITMSASAKTIGQYAFANCSSLTSLTVPASVERIEDHAFDNCTALATLEIEKSTTPILFGKGYVEKKYETWTDYRTIGIFGSSPIKDVIIGRNIELIDNNKEHYSGYNLSPFSGSYLTNVTIGNKVTKIPERFFYECYNIKDVRFDGTIVDWCKITFADQYATPFGQSSNSILSVKVDPQPDPDVEFYPVQGEVVIPEGATKIGAYSFFGQSSVTNITIPSTMATIEPCALQGFSDVYINATNVIRLDNTNSFSDIANIYVPDDATTNYKNAAVWTGIQNRIYPQGFRNVSVILVAMGESPALLPALDALEKENGDYKITTLTNLKITGTMNGWDILMIRNKMPNLRHLDLTEAEILDNDGGKEYYEGYHTTKNTISARSFYNLTNLRSVKLPQNITSIDESAFEGCTNLKEVKFMPNTCTSIKSRAFANSGLTSIEISESVKNIGYEAFYSCNSLVDVKLCKGLEVIEDRAFYDCGNLRKLVLPTSLSRINSNAFANCYSLSEIDFAEGIEENSLGEIGLTSIGYGAFQGCSRLKDLKMPTTLQRIESYAFNGCSNLNEVHVPSMLESIGDYAFTGCGLSSVYAYTAVPIPINQNTFDYSGVDLFAPSNSFYTYFLNTQWSQFLDVKEFEAIYSKWYTPRNTDYYLSVTKPMIGVDIKGYVYPGGGFVVNGVGEQHMKNLVLRWNHGSNYPSLVENGNLNIDELTFIMNLYPRKWYFFCFPCDLDIQNLTFSGNGQYVWRYYDSGARAYGGTGWKNFTGTTLKAGVGYIYQCNAEGTIEIEAKNPDYLVRNDTGTAPDRDINLISAEAANPQDASWNFVGNPNLSYYSLDDMAEDFTSPITVWNDENQTYEAVVPGDDEYDIHPFQAFFVQKPADSEAVTFRAENRLTYNQSQEKAQARSRTRGTRGVDENHLIVNIELSNGTTTDKTRVVFDDSKSLNYEIGTDANKMMSMADVPQVYTLDNKDVKYALNTRPNNNNEVRVGFMAPVSGNYTIKASRMDILMGLKDNATGIIHDLSKGGYTFLADAGANEDRFSLVRAYGTTGISEVGIEGLDIVAENGGIRIDGIANQPVSVYNVKGIRMATLSTSGNVNLASGTYIVTAGGKASKVVVR